jgi:serine/threonine-protein phosphatase 2A activator
MEPSGSHGVKISFKQVWGGDDYHFVPSIFCVSELVEHPEITPKSIHDEKFLEENYDNYICIYL